MFLELAEVKSNGIIHYFSDGYNIFDFSMPLFFIAHVFVRIYSGKTEDFGSFKLFDNIIQIIIILGGSSKLLQYIKYREEFSFFE